MNDETDAPLSSPPPLQSLLDNPNYGALDADKKVEAIRNWEQDVVRTRNQSGAWTLDSRAEFEVQTRQARQIALGVTPQTPEEILRELAEGEEDAESMKNLWDSLDEVIAAEREKREIDRRRFFPWMREDTDATRINELTGEIERVTSEAGEAEIAAARLGAEALSGKRDVAVVRGKLIVNPDLYFDRENFVKAVNSSSATEKEKMKTLSSYYRGREDVADAMLARRPGSPGLESAGAFREFATQFAADNPDATKGDVVEAFRKSGAGGGDKWFNAVASGFLGAMEGVGYLGFGLAKLSEKQGQLAENLGLTSIGQNIQESARQAQDQILNNPVVSLRETNEAKTHMQEQADVLGGYSTAQQYGQVGGQLGGQIILTMLTGPAASITRATVGQTVKGAVATEVAEEIAKGGVKKWTKEYVKNIVGPVGTMAGASSAGPVLFDAYEKARQGYAAEGFVGEELEAKARADAMTRAVRSHVVTAAVTSLFGTGNFGGAETMARLTQVAANPAARAALKKTAADYAGDVAKGAVGEGFEEALDEGINGGLDALLENPDMTFEQWFEATAFAGSAGALFGGSIQAVTTAAEAAVEGVRASPEMQQRRQVAENLRAAGVAPQTAEALEAANAQAEQDAIDLVITEVEAQMETDVTRLSEIDAELAAIPDGDARREPLVAEREEIDARMGVQADALRNYDPVATANVAVADLVDTGMDVAEARQRVTIVVNRKYSRVPVTPETLVTEAGAVELPTNTSTDKNETVQQAEAETIQQTTPGQTDEAREEGVLTGTPVTPTPMTPSFRSIAGRPVTVDGESGDLRIDEEDGTVLLDRPDQPPIIVSRNADAPINESEFSVRIDEGAEQDAEQARVLRTTIGGRPTARPIERPTPRTTFVRNDGAIVTGSTVVDFVGEGETETGDLFVTVRDREGNEFELHGDDALTVAIARRDTARDADLDTAVSAAVSTGPALDFDRVLARLIGPKAALLEVTTRNSKTAKKITPETTAKAVDELTELETQIQNENFPADIKARLLDIVNDAFDDVAQFAQSQPRVAAGNAPEAVASPAGGSEVAIEPASQGEGEVTTPSVGEMTGKIPRSSQAIASSLSRMGVSVHFTTSSELAALTASHGAEVDIKTGAAFGSTRGGLFSTRSGSPRIYVLTDNSNNAKKTLLHEARHAANAIGKQTNPEAHAAAVEALQNSPELLKAAAKKYPGFAKLNPERQLSEVLSMMADGKLDSRNVPSPILRFIESVVAALRGSVLTSEVSEINGYFADLSAILAASPVAETAPAVEAAPVIDTETARVALEATAGNPEARAEIESVLTPEQKTELGVVETTPPVVEEVTPTETEEEAPLATDAPATPDQFPVDPIPLDASPIGPRESGVTAEQDENTGIDPAWSAQVNGLIDRAMAKYPNLGAKINNTINAPARTVGLTIEINPSEMAVYTYGMSEMDAAAMIDKLFLHEATHRHAVAEIGDDVVRAYANSMSADERLDIAAKYLHRSAYPTDAAYQKAVDDFAGNNPNITEGERRVRRYRLGHEALRMNVERFTTGFTTEEDLAFLQTNPTNFARFVRYLKSYLNRLKEWYRARKDPVLGVEVARLSRILDTVQNGPRVDRGAAPFALAASPTSETSSESDSILEAAPARRGLWNRPKKGEYVPGGAGTAANWWDQRLYEFLEKARGAYKSEMKTAEWFAKDVSRAVKKIFKDDVPGGMKAVNDALGNVENRMTLADVAAIKDIKKRGLASAQSVYMKARAQANALEGAGDREGAALIRQDSRIVFNNAVTAYKDAAKNYETQARVRARAQADVDRRAALAQLPQDLQDKVENLRSRIDQLSNRMIAEGNLTDELKATIDENRGLWLHRSYEIFDDPNYSQWIREQRDPEAVRRRNKAVSFIRGDLIARDKAKRIAKGTPAAQAQIEAEAATTDALVNDVFEDYLMVADGGSKHLITGSTVSKETAALMQRGTIPQELQELWGRYDDPAVNAAKSISSISQFLSINEFFQETLNLGVSEGWLIQPTEGVPKVDAQGNRLFELFPNGGKTGMFGNTASNQYAPLAGYWGPPALAEALKQSVDDRGSHKFMQFFTAMTGYAMAMKTAGSVQSRSRNFLGNALPALVNGNIVVNPKTWNKAARLARVHMTGNKFMLGGVEATAAERAEAARLVELGVFGDTVTVNLINELTGGFAGNRKAIGLKGKSKILQAVDRFVVNPTKALYDYAGSEYAIPDEIWKYINYQAEVDRVTKYRPGAAKAAIEEEAAEIVKRTTFTYSRAPEFVKWLRRQPVIAPFITFPSEVVRVTYNQFTLAGDQIVEGLKTGNKKLAQDGYGRAAKIAIVGALVYATPAIVRSLLGFTEKDEDDLREHVAPWAKNSTLLLLPTEDRTKGISYADISYLNPYDVIFRPFRSIMRNMRDGDMDGFEIAWEATKEATDPVLSEQILLGAVLDARSGIAPTGKRIWETNDSDVDKLAKSAAYVTKTAMSPGTLDTGRRIKDAALGKVSTTGKASSLSDELIAILGPRASSIDTHTTMRMAGGKFRGETLNSRAVFTRAIKSRGTQSDQEIIDAYVRSNELLASTFRELREKYVGAIELRTMTREEAVRLMKDSGVSKSDIGDILNNRYRRLELRRQDLLDARREGTKLGQDREALYRQALELVPPVQQISEDDRQ